jgi:GTP cyclohydrolase III
MKKSILIALLFAGFTLTSNAQLSMDKLPGKVTDIAGSTSKIVSDISKEVGGLSKEEEPGVREAVTGFLGDYNNLLPKMKLDPAGFKTALDKLKASFDNKLKLAMGAAKMAKFAGTGVGAGATKVLGMLK